MGECRHCGDDSLAAICENCLSRVLGEAHARGLRLLQQPELETAKKRIVDLERELAWVQAVLTLLLTHPGLSHFDIEVGDDVPCDCVLCRRARAALKDGA